MGRIGFVVLTHSHPKQVERLLDRLALLYDSPPVSVHHDFGKCALPISLNSHVRIVRPHFNTAWGTASLVRAVFAGILSLYDRSDSPDWFVLLSGSDYPIKNSDAVVSDLEAGGCDVYIQQELIYPSGPKTAWHVLCRYRYVYSNLRLPLIGRLGLASKERLPLRPLFSPFSRRFRCYGGSQWFTANRSAAEQLLRWNEQHPQFLRYCEDRPCVDEMFFHTIFGNLKGLRKPSVSSIPNTFRCIDWTAGGRHPKELGIEDLPAIMASGAHFARKFAPENPVLDAIDESLGIPKLRSRVG